MGDPTSAAGRGSRSWGPPSGRLGPTESRPVAQHARGRGSTARRRTGPSRRRGAADTAATTATATRAHGRARRLSVGPRSSEATTTGTNSTEQHTTTSTNERTRTRTSRGARPSLLSSAGTVRFEVRLCPAVSGSSSVRGGCSTRASRQSRPPTLTRPAAHASPIRSPLAKCVVGPSRDRSEAIDVRGLAPTQVSGPNTTQLRTRSYAKARSYGRFRVCDAERWRALSAY